MPAGKASGEGSAGGALVAVLALWALGAAVGAIGPVAWAQRLGMLPLLVIAVTGMLVAYRTHPRNLARSGVFILLVAGCAWIAVTLTWAPRIQADRVGAVIGTLLLCGLGLAVARPPPAPHDRRMGLVFLLSIAFLAAALCVEAATGGAGSALIRSVESVGRAVWARGSAVLVVLLWIALGLLVARRRYLLAAILIAGAGYAIWGGTMRSAQVASLTGLIAFGAAAVAPRVMPLLVSGLFGLYAIAAPWLSLHVVTADTGFRWISSLPLSAYHRLAIWEQAGARIVENPVFGLGFGAARWISDQGARIVISADPRAQLDVMPLHTHNGWLQLWLETGVVGLALALALVFLAALGARRRFSGRPALMACSGAMAAGMTVASLSFGIWQEWWLATLTLAPILILLLFPGAARTRS